MPEAQKNYSLPYFEASTPTTNAFTDGRCSTIREMQGEHAKRKKCEKSLVLSCKLSLQRGKSW